MSEQKVVILGCGWLGQIVGEALVKKGSSVYGSFRRPEVAEKLEEIGIRGFELDFNESAKLSDAIVQDTTHVLVFITPSSSKRISYDALMTELLKQFPKTVKVIFSSSTGVYPKEGGGFIIVPILLRMGLEMKKAVGTSMFIIAIQSAVALAGDFTGKALQADNPIDWQLLSWITIVTVVGVIAGGILQKYFSGGALRQVFSYVLIGVALGMIVQFSIG